MLLNRKSLVDGLLKAPALMNHLKESVSSAPKAF